jgi:hypothetical protein
LKSQKLLFFQMGDAKKPAPARQWCGAGKKFNSRLMAGRRKK